MEWKKARKWMSANGLDYGNLDEEKIYQR